jgi:hypothetical protein
MAAASSSTGHGIAQLGPATHTYVAPARPQGNQISITSFNIGAGQVHSFSSSAGQKVFVDKFTGDMEALIKVSHVICVQEVSAIWAVFIAKLLPPGGMRPEGKLQSQIWQGLVVNGGPIPHLTNRIRTRWTIPNHIASWR